MHAQQTEIRVSGYVARIVPSGVYGFVRHHQGRDAFFHARDLQGLEFGEQLRELAVTFRLEVQPDGRLRAREIRPAREASQ